MILTLGQQISQILMTSLGENKKECGHIIVGFPKPLLCFMNVEKRDRIS
jgi:hypothetical protein